MIARKYLKYNCIENLRLQEKRNIFQSSTKLKQKERKSHGTSELHKPGQNDKVKGYTVTTSTARLLTEHLKATGGRVITRFPPEPNGILHIGHAKAININFGYAKDRDGICIMRFDDTNPEMASSKYVAGILNDVRWLGFEPYKTTYTSDYFTQLYQWATELITKKMAYVCHEKVIANPPGGDMEIIPESVWRNTLIEENLEKFEKMKAGGYKEGEAILRLKYTTEQKTVDPVAYRIKMKPHHRTESTWKIYPTYDYAHCLCDSIENITHSLCTTEFTQRRSTYYWICNALNVYCPVQTEYGRLNLHHTLLSKRSMIEMVDLGYLKGWDDPRLFTIAGLKRRGIPPACINSFCSSFGLKTESSYVSPIHFEVHVRDLLNKSARRVMAVLKPIRVELLDFPYPDNHVLQVRTVPKDSSRGTQDIPYKKIIYIDAEDFRLEADKNFYRLTLNQHVGLKHTGCVISVKEIFYSKDSSIDYIQATCMLKEDCLKPKAFIHWVASPVRCKFRLFENLFEHERPNDKEQVPNGYLTDINEESMVELEGLVDQSALRCEKCGGPLKELSQSFPDIVNDYKSQNTEPSDKNYETSASVSHFTDEKSVTSDETMKSSLIDCNNIPTKCSCDEQQNGTPLQFERVGYFCLDSESTFESPIFNRIVSLRQDSGV